MPLGPVCPMDLDFFQTFKVVWRPTSVMFLDLYSRQAVIEIFGLHPHGKLSVMFLDCTNSGSCP